MRRTLQGCLLLGAVALLPSHAGDSVKVPHPEDFVNVLAGAAGGQAGGTHHSNGNTLPIVARPWGFNHWSPQTTDSRTSWWFDANEDRFYGFRCTHQPSPWIGDYAWFLLYPHTGYQGNTRMGFTSYHAEGAIKPYLMDLTLGPYGQRLELTPTTHGALLQVTFPASQPPNERRICVRVPKGLEKDEEEKVALKQGRPSGLCRVSSGAIDLETRRYAEGVPTEGDFGLYARLEARGLETEEMANVDCFEQDTMYEPLDMQGSSRSSEPGKEACQRRCATTAGCTHWTFWGDGGCHVTDDKAKKKDNVRGLVAGPPRCPSEAYARECCFVSKALKAQVKIGTSLISQAQALRSLDAEVGTKSFKALVDAGKALWRRELRRVEVLDAGPPTSATFRRLEVFYTCLYRVLLFPRRLDEETPEGLMHWSPYNGRVVAGVGVTDNGFWDTFRTVYPLLAIAYPAELGQMVQGWLNAYREGGWLPKWASPGYRGSMVGTFADVVVADAVIKNISGFDRKVAWDALHKDAFVVYDKPKDASRGKFGLTHYMSKGYIPIDVGVPEACSRTLDFAYADAATAAAAELLGFNREATDLQKRSERALQALYEPKSGLMGHRKSNEDFVQETPETWGDCYTEGSAWHHSFPPFNVKLLAELHGGRAALMAKLHELFTTPGDFKPGSYKTEIHEMREMRMLGMGQYAHNNQPTHHLAYLFSMLGDQNSTAKLVRQILSRAYSPEGFAGDEDNGEMGAWYVLSALGIFAPASGVSEDYVLGAVPLFPRVRLHDLDLTIEAPAAPQAVPLISQVLWRSKKVRGSAIPYSQLRSGGVLRFMAPGDGQFGQVVSSLRGVMHQAARSLQNSAENAVAATPSPSSGLRPPEMMFEDAIIPDELATRSHDVEEEDSGASWMLLVVLFLGLCSGCRLCLKAASVSGAKHKD